MEAECLEKKLLGLELIRLERRKRKEMLECTSLALTERDCSLMLILITKTKALEEKKLETLA